MVKEEDYLLTNQEILGGIKSSIERGGTLKEAMMSFYQSGYKKQEIEDAARAYLYLQRGAPEENLLKEREKNEAAITEEKNKEKMEKEEGKKQSERDKNEKMIYGFGETRVPTEEERKARSEGRVLQKISGYDAPKKSPEAKGKTLTVVLIVTLIVLLGILGLVFLFKEELINFINGLFG